MAFDLHDIIALVLSINVPTPTILNDIIDEKLTLCKVDPTSYVSLDTTISDDSQDEIIYLRIRRVSEPFKLS